MINKISREQIKTMLDTHKSITLIEALPKKYYDAEHLPGAINMPHDEIRKLAAQMLPNQEQFIAVYCSNSQCQNSHIAAQTLMQLGYSNVYQYVEGKQDWIEAGYPVEEASLASN